MTRRLVPLALTAGLAGVHGCGDAAPRESAPSGTIVIAELAGVGTLLPIAEQTALDAEINALLYLTLASGRWENGELRYVADETSLAERWALDPDSTAVTYTLRRDAVWSDGTRITAHDVVFTYDLARDTIVASTALHLLANMDSVVARDARTVTFYFRRRSPDLISTSGELKIVPRHLFAETDRAALRSHPRVVDPANGRLVVSGPFAVGSWERGSQITLVPNPRTFTVRPSVARVIFREIPEPATRLIELENGSLDVTWPIPFERASAIEAHPDLRLEVQESRQYDFVAWNPATVPAFADPDVRRALSLAIDRAQILAALDMNEYAEAAAGPYSPIFRALRDPAVRPDPYLPDSARAILERRGFADSNRDGVLEKAGRPLRFTLLTNAGNARRANVMQLLQAQLRRIGVDVQARVLDSNTFWDAFHARRFEAVLAGWSVGLTPEWSLRPFFYPDQPYNAVGYENPRVTALIDTAMAQASPEAAAPYWRAAARDVVQDRPYAWLYYLDGLVGVNERVQNTRIDTYGVYQNLYAWKIEGSGELEARAGGAP